MSLTCPLSKTKNYQNLFSRPILLDAFSIPPNLLKASLLLELEASVSEILFGKSRKSL